MADRARRAFLAALAMAPALVRADAAVRRVATLSVGQSGEPVRNALLPFGWEAGRNLRYEARVVQRYAAAPERAAAVRELLATRPEVVVTETGACTRAILDADPKVPVVAYLWDPVLEGFAQSLAHPGGSVTGVSAEAPRVMLFRIETMRLLLPELRRFHTLATPEFHADPVVAWIADAARSRLGVELVMHDVATLEQASDALGTVRDRRREGAFLFRVPHLDGPAVARRALQARVALIYAEARTGALLACNFHHADRLRSVAFLTDKILRGASPATLPFETPTRVQLDVNRTTARALGITIPPELLIRATNLHD